MKINRKEMPHKDDSELWENGTLGESAEHAVEVSDELDKAIDDGLGLEMISIRLQKALIADLKGLASKHGIAYQPFIRMVLTKYVANAKRSERVMKVPAAKRAKSKKIR